MRQQSRAPDNGPPRSGDERNSARISLQQRDCGLIGIGSQARASRSHKERRAGPLALGRGTKLAAVIHPLDQRCARNKVFLPTRMDGIAPLSKAGKSRPR
jgi:hypothetical protein